MTPTDTIANDTKSTTTTEDIASKVIDVMLDEFGRDAAERTVELSPRDAESVNMEVELGKHQTYEDALSYVIARGLAEIQRQRKAAAELRAARLVKEKGKLYSSMLSMNPALVADPTFVNKMLAELGVKAKA